MAWPSWPANGRRQRIVRYQLIAADGKPITTRALVEVIYPRLDWSKTQRRWRWYRVREAARRYAVPVLSPR